MGPRETNLNILQEEISQKIEVENLRLVKNDISASNESDDGDKEKKAEQKRTPKSAVIELEKLLQTHNPEKWSPNSIKNWNKSLCGYLGRMIKRNILTWEDVSKVGNGQYEKGFHFAYSPDWTLESSIAKIKEIIIENKLSSFSPKDIKTNKGLYSFLIEQIRRGETDWEEIARQIKADLGVEFFNRDWEMKKEKTFDDVMNELNMGLKENCPEVITPSYLYKKHYSEYNFFRKNVTDTSGVIEWCKVKNELLPEFREKFIFQEKITLEKIIERINEGLRGRTPETIYAEYLKKEFPYYIEIFAKKFRNKQGHIDWEKLINHPNFNPEMRLKFKFPVSISRNFPTETYSDSQEIENLMKEKEKYIYTFIECMDSKDLDIRNDICLLLVELAQKGNLEAEKKLTDLVLYVVEKWVENDLVIQNFKFHQEKIYEIIRSCIYNYKKEKPFMGYIYGSLRKATFGLEKMKELEYIDEIDNEMY